MSEADLSHATDHLDDGRPLIFVSRAERVAPDTIDPVPALLLEAWLGADADGRRLEAVAIAHGRLRAREDRTLSDTLGEYPALRRLAEGRDDPGADGQARLDRASVSAATAFCAERSRQYAVVRRGQDHDLRGCVNAIRLATVVLRQTGRDTSEVIERHITSVSALLDQARKLLAPREDRALRPADMPPDDLAVACRRQVLEWNERHSAQRCGLASATSCKGRFDTARVGETLDAMLEAAVRRAGTGAALNVTLGSARGMALVTVEGVPGAGGDPGPDVPAASDRPLDWMLGHQTAVDHLGSLESEPGSDRVVFRLALRHDELAVDA